MIRKSPLRLIIILTAMLVVTVIGVALVQADNGETPNAVTAIETNLRTGPGRQYDTLIVLPTGTALVVEGRSSDLQWLLVHTPDKAVRGWAARKLLTLKGITRVSDLPVFSVTISGTPGALAQSTIGPTFAPTYVPNTAIDGPIIPEISAGIRDTIQAIYDHGKSMGNNPRAFVKVGDCMTYRWTFLNVFGYGTYDLGKYGDLQGIINYFNAPVRAGVPNSWVVNSVAAANGFNSTAVLDAEWSDPKLCQKNEMPIDCELRLNKPSFAVIMFGASDVFTMTAEQFNDFMFEIIDHTEKAGVVPILSTFPENPSVPAQSHQLNQIVFQLGQRRNLPVMNFAAAVAGLPNHGLESDNIHLTLPPGDKSGYFTDANLQFGYTVRNLVVLQALNKVVNSIRH